MITKEEGVIAGLVILSIFALSAAIALYMLFCCDKASLNRCLMPQYRLDEGGDGGDGMSGNVTGGALPDGRGTTINVGASNGRGGRGADNFDEWKHYVTVKEMYEKQTEGSIPPEQMKRYLVEAEKRKREKARAKARLAAGGNALVVPAKPPARGSSRGSGDDDNAGGAGGKRSRFDPLSPHLNAARAQHPLVGFERSSKRTQHRRHHSSWEPQPLKAGPS